MNREREQVNILVVDDEESIVDFVKMGLEAEGFTVYTAYDGYSAVAQVKKYNINIVILDIMLPGLNGCDACLEIKKHSSASVIILTAKDEIDDRVKGLNLGADDYMVKPFSFKELLARINARLRNNPPGAALPEKLGDFRINDAAHEIFFRGELLELSLTEYNLLKFLLHNNGLVLSKQLILQKVWGYDFNGEENIVEVYIRYLRNKLGDEGFEAIRTIRGVGYKMVI
jgi:two-component system OmpR family response regulator